MMPAPPLPLTAPPASPPPTPSEREQLLPVASPARAFLDWAAVAFVVGTSAWAVAAGGGGLVAAGPLAIGLGLAGIPLALLAADLLTGSVHFLADRFGYVDTPVVGELFIRKFRVHHTHPKLILELPLREVLAGGAIVAVPLVTAVALLGGGEGLLQAALSWALGWLVLWSVSTNLIHRWAHAERPPALIVPLQRSGFILSPEHHDVHHTAPYEKHYCITAGWLNPWLDRVGAWERFAALLDMTGLPRAPHGA
jgi:hypothetical protein